MIGLFLLLDEVGFKHPNVGRAAGSAM